MQERAGSEATHVDQAPAQAAVGAPAGPLYGNAAVSRLVAATPGRLPRGLPLPLAAGNVAVSRLLQRDSLPGGAPVPTADPGAADEALRLNGLAMPGLLSELDAKGRLWVSLNREALVRTPGVGPQRMAIAVEAVLAGREASEERLAQMMGEMQTMGLPADQQEAVAVFCGAFGLQTPRILDAYVKGAGALRAEWATLSGHDRARRLGVLAGASLKEAGVPEPLQIEVRDIAEGGLWERKGWRIVVAARIGNLKEDQNLIALAAATVYHEARHGEQDFTILRALAGQGKDAAAIMAMYETPAPIIAAAVADPIAPTDPRARRARDWLDSSLGVTDLPYDDRPEERDAHSTGSIVADRVRGGAAPDRSSKLRGAERDAVPTVKGLTGAPVTPGGGA